MTSVEAFAMGSGTTSISPVEELTASEVIDHLEEFPNDDYMHIYLSEQMDTNPDPFVQEAIRRFEQEPSTITFGILTVTDHDTYPELIKLVQSKDQALLLSLFDNHHNLSIRGMKHYEYIGRNLQWKAIFHKNRTTHTPLTQISPGTIGLTEDVLTAIAASKNSIHVSNIETTSVDTDLNTRTSLREADLEATISKSFPIVNEICSESHIISRGFRGTAFVPIYWNMMLNDGVHQLSGVMGSSGKGFEKESSAASGFMETIERFSAGYGATKEFPNGYVTPLGLVRRKFSEIDVNALDPNALSLRIPYEDQELHWVNAIQATQEGYQDILVPGQFVFEFSNFDEHQIFGGSSNGLASGNSIEEAKLHGILEIVERDGDYNMFYHPDRVFQIATDDPKISEIQEKYDEYGLTIQVLDLTTEFGIPVYRAFVEVDGNIISGSGAHLDGKVALNRAICELAPKCFMWKEQYQGFENISKPVNSNQMDYQELPDYSTGSVTGDLSKVEEVLTANNFSPVYVDLTRSDVEIPVVRVIVPGLEIAEGFSPRLIKNYLQEMKEYIRLPGLE